MTNILQIFWSGEKFFLFGDYRSFFVWNGKSMDFESYNSFPDDFGIIEKDKGLNTKINDYPTPAFSNCVKVGEKLWFCPLQTNMIIYIDCNTLESGEIEIIKQNTDVHSNLLSSMGLFQYVIDNRYLGFYDFNTMSLMEIDTIEMTVSKKELQLNREFTLDLLKDNVFQENNSFDRFIFWEKVRGIADDQK